MDKKLPNVFQNDIGNIENNKTIYYSDNEKKEHQKTKSIKSKFDINQKIIDIFKFSKNIYKIKVDITLDSGVVTKYLIGRTNSSVITLDSEIIRITDIKDIKLNNDLKTP